MPTSTMAAAITVLLGGASLLICVLKFLNRWLTTRCLKLAGTGVKLPPGSLGWPFFGEMRDFLKCFKNEKPDLFVTSREARYGKGGLYTTLLFGSPSIMATSPEMLKFVLKRDDVFGTGWPAQSKVMGNNSVVCVSGELHKNLRRYLFDAVSSPTRMNMAIPRITAAMKANLNQWAKQRNVNTRECTRKLVFYIIADIFLSVKPSPEMDALEQEYSKFMIGIRALPIYLPGTAHYVSVNSRRRLIRKFQQIIHQRRSSQDHHEDILQSLMDARDPTGVPLTDEQLHDNLMTLMLAGYESSAYAMMWVMILVAKNAEVLAKLREEHMKVKERVGEADLTLDDTTNRMPYTQKVFDETLRLVNVAPMVFRTALEDVNYKGYRIPKGWKAMPWLRAPHMDPQYFPEPEKFNPDRWDDKDVKAEAFHPFGGGGRTCVGNQFARLQVFLFIHHLSLGYKWEFLNPSAKIQHLPHPKPVDGGPVVLTPL